MALPRHFVTGMLIFALFISAGIFLMMDFGINNTQVNEFNRTFYIIDNITGDIASIKGNITNAETDFGAFGVLNSLINSAWISLKILFKTGDVAQAIADDSAIFFGVPLFIPLLLGSIVVVIIAFAIWGAIFQREL